MSGTLNIILANFGGGSAPVGFFASITNPNGAAVSDPQLAIRSDQLNLSVGTSASGTTQLTVLRLALDGTVTWQTNLADAADYPFGGGIDIDSAGNVVIAGAKYDSVNAINTGYVVKFNNSGVVQWQRRIDSSSTQFYSVAIDASDNLYCVGAGFITPPASDMYVAKFDSSGAIQYRRSIGTTGTTTSELAYSVAIRSTSEFVLTGVNGSGGFAFFDGHALTCSQSTGQTVVGVTQRDPEGNKRQEGIAVVAGESTGIFYNAVQIYNSSSIGSAVLIKYAANGAISWQQLLQQANTSLQIRVNDVCMDASKTHVYTCGNMSTSGARVGSDVQLAKYVASTGELVWQRSLSSPANNLYLSGVRIRMDSLDNMYVTVTQLFGGVTSSFILKMPGSGAGVGNSVVLSATTYTYNATTHSSGSGNLTGFAYSPTNNSNTQSVLTPTATSSTGTLVITEEVL
jgi:hypothetical protein